MSNRKKYAKPSEYTDLIMQMRSEGKTYKNIADEIKKRSGLRPNETSISLIVKKEKKKLEEIKAFWSFDRELDLLINFYNMSVDEARERYNLSYSEIAKKLEDIHDMTEEHHSLLLVKAAEAINANKEVKVEDVEEEPKMSFRERRKAKKLERKAAKLFRRYQIMSRMMGLEKVE